MTPWILISVLSVLVVLGLLLFFVIKNKDGKHEPDYRLFFILGITWLPIGIIGDNPGLWGFGIVLMIAGLVNRNKWKEQPKWSELPDQQRRFKLLVIGGVLALFLMTLLVYFIAR